MARITIEILNWEKYNPRRDIKRPHWFALSNDLTEDDDFFAITDAEFRAWVHILSKASKKQSAIVTIDLDATDRKAKIASDVVRSAIDKLSDETRACLKVVALEEDEFTKSVRDPYAIRTRSVQHTTRQDTTEQQEGVPSFPVVQAHSREVAIKSSRETFLVSDAKDLVPIISDSIKARWAELYCEEYLRRELAKILNYLEANPRKNKKTTRGWISFCSNWFDRGWARYQAQFPGNKAGAEKCDIEAILREQGKL